MQKKAATLPKSPDPTPDKDVQQQSTMATRPPMPLPHSISSSSPNLHIPVPEEEEMKEIPNVLSGVNTVQKRKVKTIGSELTAILAMRNMEKQMVC